MALPEGASIDGSDPDLWRYPTGTRLYKTFSLDGLKLETRVLEKTGTGVGPDAWSSRAYAWLADQSGVELVEPAGRADVLGTSHDIPSVAQCRSCHSAAGQDMVNGFTAIQLNHARAGVPLATLLRDGSLVSPLADELLEQRAQAGRLEVAHDPAGRYLAPLPLHPVCEQLLRVGGRDVHRARLPAGRGPLARVSVRIVRRAR